jgi:uncharacterized protein YbjT (DUF2867 family)
VRSGESASALAAAGAEPAEGDLARPATIAGALSGVDRLFLLSSPHHDVVAWQSHAIDAAAGAGVRLIVRSSMLGADAGSPMTFARQHGKIDDHLRASGVPYAVVRPNVFLQNVTETNLPSIGPDGVLYTPAGDARLSMADTRDAAEIAVLALTGAGSAGEEHDVTGPDALSYADVAARLSAALGRPISYVSPPLDTYRETLAGFGLDRFMANGLAEMFEDYQRSGTAGYAARVTDTVERLMGHAARSLDGLLAEWSQAHGAGPPS